MTEATERFFASLPSRAPVALRNSVLLRPVLTGTLQIDLVEGPTTDHWRVAMAPGQAEVTRADGEADARWTSNPRLFDRLVTGETQALAAVLRNEATLSGNVLLWLMFRRFFPDPPGTRDPRQRARERNGRPR
ncbi:SCP2 sterol-binding domain-containing protein [Micromonospora mirobrigensis]|uniref:SCP-2 sterol transfer family n=1 Tax=Micromonospora mirobrigensis TaxID=262898 RepID=A0A1C4ZU14_9ACTN|nr:SCP2 sterol-binding domain-containing protein [Micromonospora mirobrigensis]SCF36356.1 SCP-2 sterol transfer family [Micromonospora mirobrigensis]